MANINGIEVKNLKNFSGHEGEPLLQGSVYYKGNKLGFWSQDGHGGCDNYDFNVNVLNEAVLKAASVLSKKERQYFDIDLLMNDVVTLCLLEKEYKKFVKKGFPTMVAGIVWGSGAYSARAFKHEKFYTLEYKQKLVEEVLGCMYNKECEVSILVFNTLDDFNISRGTTDGLEKEKLRKKKEEEERLKKSKAEEKARENKKKDLELRNNGRFVATELKNRPAMKITDTSTGKSVEIGLYAFKEVYNSLIELMC